MQDWQFIRLSRQDGDFSSADDSDDQDRLWFQTPREQRLNAARRHVGISLSRLDLDLRVYKCLKRCLRYPDVATLMLAGREIHKVRGFGDLGARETHDALAPLFAEAQQLAGGALGDPPPGPEEAFRARSAAATDDEDLAAQWRALGVTVLPTDFADPRRSSVVAALEQVLQQSLVNRGQEGNWTVLEQRFGLGGAAELTLEAIGDSLGVTRQRVLQRELRALRDLKAALTELPAVLAPARLHPSVARALRALQLYLRELRESPARASVLARHANAILGVDDDQIVPVVTLLARVHDLAPLRLERKGLEAIWAADDKGLRHRLAERLLRLHTFLTSATAEALSAMGLTAALNQSASAAERLTEAELLQLVNLCSTVERIPDGRFRGRFDALVYRHLQVERILLEKGEPLRITDILSTMNQRLAMAGEPPLRRLNLSNQLIANPHFVPIGRTGRWSLAQWRDVETGTIFQLMER
ncbi:MAG: sigma factor-like helix-turn-helix DNA-binding protein [Anaerolineae bacterium]